LSEGVPVTADLVREIADDELSMLRSRIGEELWGKGRFVEARQVFEEVALSDSFPAFLTLVAQRHID
jgi:malate synthase